MNVPVVRLAEVRDGLARGEFFLEYQPIVSLADGRCLGAEALVRWRRGDHVIPPSEFIPMVENTPVSGFITYWVMENGDGGARRMAEGEPGRVRVDQRAAGNPRARRYRYAAVKSGLMSLSSQVMLEITERGIPDPLGVASINDRGGTGVRVALDDVTLAGGVSMAVLMRCPFDAIKLDKSLIDQITPDAPRPDWMNAVQDARGIRRADARDCRGCRHGIPGRHAPCSQRVRGAGLLLLPAARCGEVVCVPSATKPEMKSVDARRGRRPSFSSSP